MRAWTRECRSSSASIRMGTSPWQDPSWLHRNDAQVLPTGWRHYPLPNGCNRKHLSLQGFRPQR